MRKNWLFILSIILFLFAGMTAADASSTAFQDVPDTHWAKEEIHYLVNKEIIGGYPDGSFGTNDPITRAQAATMIMRYFGWTNTNPDDPGYPDLKPGSHWAYHDMATVYHLGIFTPEGHYMPNKELTRAEMADMLVKTFDLSGIKGAKFTDLSRDHWAYHAINLLASNHITSGYADGTFRPEASVTRAEFAVFMSRAMDERFRTEDEHPGIEGMIYDLEINDQVIQLENPLLLDGGWLAPTELFERLGFTVHQPSPVKVILMASDGTEIVLELGQTEVWVGDTSVAVNDPLVIVEGQPYVRASSILRALEQPLVFYPNQFLIRLETPRWTSAGIVAELPEAALDVIHAPQPYWHWTKRDRDHLELLRKGGVTANRDQLVSEMEQLMQAYYAVEQQKQDVRGLIYFSNELSGKLDALARGLEARYFLLAGTPDYRYPDIGKSTKTSLNSPYYSSIYTVSDHSFMDIAKSSQRLLQEIEANTKLPLALFEGLHVYSVPFTILEKDDQGRENAYAGLASGSQSMIVVNSGIHTFFHEFGHNWDDRYGDHEEYLRIRGKTDYVPASNEWQDRIHENFAEDFAAAFYPAKYGEGVHKAVFGMPSEDMRAAIREYVSARSVATGRVNESLTVNGASFVPDVIYTSDGNLHVKGNSAYSVYLSYENLATKEHNLIEVTKNGDAFDTTLSLPERGMYHVQLGGTQAMVVYE